MNERRPTGSILVVDDEVSIQKLVASALTRAGYDVTLANDGEEALARLAEAIPDLIISDVMMPNVDGFELVRHVRTDAALRSIPIIMLTAKGESDDIVSGLELGADDYLAKPFKMAELLARVRSKIERPPVPSDHLRHDRQTNVMSEQAFWETAEREIDRAVQSGRAGSVACIAVDEWPRIQERLGSRALAELAKQIAIVLLADAQPLDVIGRAGTGAFLLLLPESADRAAKRRLDQIAQQIVDRTFVVGGERVRLTPIVGYLEFAAESNVDDARRQVFVALEFAELHLDLQAVRYGRSMDAVVERARSERRRRFPSIGTRLRTPLQIAIVLFVGLVLPFLIYVAADRAGYNLAGPMYIVVVVALLMTAFLIWVEGIAALRPIQPPAEPGAPYLPASAIIAAYLPNEAATIMETVEAFRRIDYPAPLQIILAYNTPKDHPVEEALRKVAAEDPRFVPLRVQRSTSKAQNVNAALSETTGEIVGVFDADHQPAPDSFRRAWQWLSNGYDVVQGHCVVRNGGETWVARSVAVEFESIYAVSHPGRARLHGFGVFGGSNGYWRTDLLRAIRMHGFMLTEDIDSSMRVVEAGGKIASDPTLLSRELAPVTLTALWNQRMRWAQGWFQVSRKHVLRGLRSSHLSIRQKAGLFYLLGWREIYPWVSLQMIPIVAFWATRAGALDSVDWFIRIFVFTTAFTLSAGPAQTLFAYKLAAPDIKQHGRWFVAYLVVSTLFYTEYKNMIGRVAQIKELMRERQWKVTPRAAGKEASAD